MTIPRMLTVKELAAECKGRGISEHFIRQGIKSGRIPHIMAGRKALINADQFAQMLCHPDRQPEPQTGVIRPVPER